MTIWKYEFYVKYITKVLLIKDIRNRIKANENENIMLKALSLFLIKYSYK